MGKSVILIVIDSLAWKPLLAHLDKLPAFKWLYKRSKHGSMINNLRPPTEWDYPIVLTSFCAATSLWTGTTPTEHRMLTSAWYHCVCSHQKKNHNRPNFSRKDIKAKFIWEQIPDAVALHTLLFPMICYNCKLEDAIFKKEAKIRFPHAPELRFTFPAKVTKALAKQSVQILRDKKPSFFTCGLYGLDTPSHYNWNAFNDFRELLPAYKVIDDYLMAIMPFLKENWFMITTQHGMDDWYITSKKKTGRPKGKEGIHGDHDRECPYFTNMDKPKTILDVYEIMMEYVKRERE